jgi:hypothetical protein
MNTERRYWSFGRTTTDWMILNSVLRDHRDSRLSRSRAVTVSNIFEKSVTVTMTDSWSRAVTDT